MSLLWIVLVRVTVCREVESRKVGLAGFLLLLRKLKVSPTLLCLRMLFNLSVRVFVTGRNSHLGIVLVIHV